MFKVLFTTLISLSLIPYGNVAMAQEKAESINTTEKLNSRILKLQQQIIEMQKKHDSEMAALKKEIEELVTKVARQKKEEDLAALRQAAKTEVTETIATEGKPGEVVFESGALGLQALNPEISVTGDFLFSHRQDSTSDESSDFDFRTLGLHIESWLDPYTRLKAAIPVTEDDAKLGEGYITLYNIAEDLNFTLGKFRQQFGVVNRWHKHGLDQVDFPLALRQVFGDGGLNQSGLSLDWMMPPAGEASQQLTFQVTDGSNSRLFADNARSRPSLLSHYKNYRDLSKDTYMEWGLTGLMGWNDEWDISGGASQNSSQLTTALGADFSVLWEPAEKMRYRNIEWRSEAYWLNKELLAPDGSGCDTIDAWGFYSYLQSKISRTVDIGIRGDFYVPDTKGYANLSDSLSLSPLAVTRDNPYLWQVSPYVTWWQSPFVKFRAEYDYSNGKGIENPEHVIWLQCVFSAGPHKHERY
jgi:hypothetical protein